MVPYSYPERPHIRQHAPQYTSIEPYRPWLRDEFVFRCVYCLHRERWGQLRRAFEIEHFVPQALDPAAALDYDNLLYACASCNAAKKKEVVPNPCDCMLSSAVEVHDDGTIEAKTRETKKIVRVLGLDDPEFNEFRMLLVGIVAMRMVRPDLFLLVMKYPDNLPDLAALRPPSNARPEGVTNSHRSRRERGELPEIYY